ncbi:MAG: OmpH family outer membrane protein [Pseudomonadales bacterium]|nr:OmpH family outer membrane protein [Pseudomonadales bacterium]
MMVKSLLGKIFLTVTFLVSLSNLAQAADESAETGNSGLKIAVLDMRAALFNTEKAKAADAEMKVETAADEAKVRNLATEAQTLQQRLQKDAAVLSPAEQKKLNDQIEEIGVQYQYLVQKLQELVQQRQQEFQQALAPNLFQAIQEVVDAENYDIVLRAEAAVHFRSSYDITARVTEILNRQ